MNWYVLFVLVVKEDKLCSLLRKNGLDAFIPMYEYYRRDIKGNAIKPLFPGYIFVRSNLEQLDFDQFLFNIKEPKEGLIKELKKADVSALRDDEIKMFEYMLDGKGILRMSQAFIEDKRAKIYKGPLVHYQDHIVKVDKHNKLATLDLEFMDRRFIAGLEITSKIR